MLRDFFAFFKYVKINFECLISIKQKNQLTQFCGFDEEFKITFQNIDDARV